MLKVERHVVGALETNCYVLEDSDTGSLALIDPGDASSEDIEKILSDRAERFLYILLTHGHFDHIMAAHRYRLKTNAKIVISREEKDFTSNNALNLSTVVATGMQAFEADIFTADGESLDLGNTKITTLSTPGHTRGSVCFLAENLIFSGDTLLKGSIGRTDLITGDFEKIKASLKRLCELSGDYIVYPGHGVPTTLDFERRNNSFLVN